MKLDKVHIEGYKSLRDVTLRIDRELTTIIGVNDVGKSSVLKAINIFLNDVKPEQTDFHANMSEISITLTFRIETEEEQSKLQHLSDTSNDRFSLTKVFKVEDEKIKAPEILLSETKLTRGQWKELWELLPQFIYVESVRDADDISKVSTTSTLGKLLRPLIQDIGDKKEELESALRQRIEALRKDLEDYLIEQTPNVKGLTIDPRIQLEKAIDLEFSIEDTFNYLTSVTRRGSGVQSSLVVGIFRLYAKYGIGKNILFGIEEPEAFLHPGAQRRLFSALHDVAKHDAQVIVTTHSTIFIDRGRLAGISLLKRNPNGGVEVKRMKDQDDLKVVSETLEQRNSDLLLWNAVLLVEGRSDTVFFDELSKIVLQEWHQNFDNLGINVVAVGGKNKMEYVANAKVLSCFGVPFLVVLDRDNDSADDIRKELKLPKDRVIVLTKRELENYYPPDTIRRAFPEESLDGVAFGDETDVKDMLLDRLGVNEVHLARKVAQHIQTSEIHRDLLNVIIMAVDMVDSDLGSKLRKKFHLDTFPEVSA